MRKVFFVGFLTGGLATGLLAACVAVQTAHTYAEAAQEYRDTTRNVLIEFGMVRAQLVHIQESIDELQAQVKRAPPRQNNPLAAR